MAARQTRPLDVQAAQVPAWSAAYDDTPDGKLDLKEFGELVKDIASGKTSIDGKGKVNRGGNVRRYGAGDRKTVRERGGEPGGFSSGYGIAGGGGSRSSGYGGGGGGGGKIMEAADGYGPYERASSHWRHRDLMYTPVDRDVYGY